MAVRGLSRSDIENCRFAIMADVGGVYETEGHRIAGAASTLMHFGTGPKCLDPQAKLGRFVEANNRPDDSSVDQGANTRANKEANFRFGSSRDSLTA